MRLAANAVAEAGECTVKAGEGTGSARPTPQEQQFAPGDAAQRAVQQRGQRSEIALTQVLGIGGARSKLRREDIVVDSVVEIGAVMDDIGVTMLADRLALLGAMTDAPPVKSPRAHLRMWGSLAAGGIFSLLTYVLKWLPVWALHWLFIALPQRFLGMRVVGQIAPYVDANLCASGYGAHSRAWRHSIAKSVAAAGVRWGLYLYLCLILPAEKMTRLTWRLLDLADWARLESALRETDGCVLATLHAELMVLALVIGLARSGRAIALIADLEATGVALARQAHMNEALSADSDRQKYQAVARHIINSHMHMASKKLLEYLRAGAITTIAFDAPPRREEGRKALATVSLMGREVYRNDGAAWLAAWSGKPVLFVGTYWTGKRVALDIAPAMYPDVDLLRKQQIEMLSRQLYATGEAFLRRHPEAWMVWSYIEQLVAPHGAGREAREASYAKAGE